jgi:hypothetical protein
MPALVVPKTRILTGAGYLYKAPIGTALPGQITATVTNKALTSNVVTLTTSASHGFTTGDVINVSIGDAVFDGQFTVASAPTGTTLTYAKTATNVSSTAATGTIVGEKAGGTVAGGVFTDAWPAGWVPVGVTKDGSEFSWSPQTGNVEVAEYLLPLKIVTTGVESSIAFAIAEFTAKNLAFALNGGTVTTVSGTGATLLTEVTPPPVGQEVRYMIGWESEDWTERAVFRQCLQGGDVKIAHKKGVDNASIGVEFKLEQPSLGLPFRRFYAGSVPVGS